MPKAPLAIAKATGASFIREVVTGLYESDMACGRPTQLPCTVTGGRSMPKNVRIFANITPEFASPLGTGSVAQRARKRGGLLPVDAS